MEEEIHSDLKFSIENLSHGSESEESDIYPDICGSAFAGDIEDVGIDNQSESDESDIPESERHFEICGSLVTEEIHGNVNFGNEDQSDDSDTESGSHQEVCGAFVIEEKLGDVKYDFDMSSDESDLEENDINPDVCGSNITEEIHDDMTYGIDDQTDNTDSEDNKSETDICGSHVVDEIHGDIRFGIYDQSGEDDSEESGSLDVCGSVVTEEIHGYVKFRRGDQTGESDSEESEINQDMCGSFVIEEECDNVNFGKYQSEQSDESDSEESESHTDICGSAVINAFCVDGQSDESDSAGSEDHQEICGSVVIEDMHGDTKFAYDAQYGKFGSDQSDESDDAENESHLDTCGSIVFELIHDDIKYGDKSEESESEESESHQDVCGSFMIEQDYDQTNDTDSEENYCLLDVCGSVVTEEIHGDVKFGLNDQSDETGSIESEISTDNCGSIVIEEIYGNVKFSMDDQTDDTESDENENHTDNCGSFTIEQKHGDIKFSISELSDESDSDSEGSESHRDICGSALTDEKNGNSKYGIDDLSDESDSAKSENHLDVCGSVVADKTHGDVKYVDGETDDTDSDENESYLDICGSAVTKEIHGDLKFGTDDHPEESDSEESEINPDVCGSSMIERHGEIQLGIADQSNESDSDESESHQDICGLAVFEEIHGDIIYTIEDNGSENDDETNAEVFNKACNTSDFKDSNQELASGGEHNSDIISMTNGDPSADTEFLNVEDRNDADYQNHFVCGDSVISFEDESELSSDDGFCGGQPENLTFDANESLSDVNCGTPEWWKEQGYSMHDNEHSTNLLSVSENGLCGTQEYYNATDDLRNPYESKPDDFCGMPKYVPESEIILCQPDKFTEGNYPTGCDNHDFKCGTGGYKDLVRANELISEPDDHEVTNDNTDDSIVVSETSLVVSQSLENSELENDEDLTDNDNTLSSVDEIDASIQMPEEEHFPEQLSLENCIELEGQNEDSFSIKLPPWEACFDSDIMDMINSWKVSALNKKENQSTVACPEDVNVALSPTSKDCVPEPHVFEPDSEMFNQAETMRKQLQEGEVEVRAPMDSYDQEGQEGSNSRITLEAMGLKIGDRVIVGGVKSGILRFCGKTQFASGIWAGIELDEPAGKNDGSVSGVTYFKCSPKHGIFAPVNKICREGMYLKTPSHRGNIDHGLIDTSHVTAKVDTGLYRRRVGSAKHPGVGEELEVGERVLVAGQRKGVIKFAGQTHFAPGWWYGIELDRPVGKNDGSVNGTRYFTSKPKHGVFAPQSRVQRIPDTDRKNSSDSIVDHQRLAGVNNSESDSSHGVKKQNTRPRSSESTRSTTKQYPAQTDAFTLQKGMSVFCNNELGTLRYIGPVDFADGVWLGVELRTPRGKNDGSVQGKRYFTCHQNYGVLVRPSKVTVRGINGAKLLGDTN